MRPLQTSAQGMHTEPAVLPSILQRTMSRNSYPQSRRALDLFGIMLYQEVVLLRLPSQPLLYPL
jgi:hypothetical protein